MKGMVMLISMCATMVFFFECLHEISGMQDYIFKRNALYTAGFIVCIMAVLIWLTILDL